MKTTLSFFARARAVALMALVSLCLGLGHSAHAASSVTVAWNPNPETDIAGYRLHYGTTSGNYTSFVDVVSQTSVTLSTLPQGTYFAAVTALNIAGIESGLSDEVAFSITPPPPSNNANLASLTPSAGTLSPAFASGTTTYSASVPNATASITVTPTPAHAGATVRVNGVNVSSGSASAALNLSVGTNAISIVVTAQDGIITKTYTLTVTRAASTNANLASLAPSTGTLSPVFASGTTTYSASVPNATASITVTPVLADANASVKINGATVSPGSASAALNLNVGTNAISIAVTAQDGTNTKTYTLTVTRAASTNANLASLASSAGTLSPVFASGTTTYSASVPNATASITITPTPANANASVTVNGVTVPSGSASAALNLNVGTNAISIAVTAQDGITTKTYTLTVTRAASTNANLASLAPSAGTLSPVFAGGTTTYSASVPNATASITITPTPANANASVAVNGVTVPSGSASAALNLNVGTNAISIAVTAQDGTTTKTYTLTVNRTSPDSIAPGLSVLNPVNGGLVIGIAGEQKTISGIASDNMGVTQVLVSLNGSSFAAASLTAGVTPTAPVKWNLSVTPENGINVLSAKALDAQDNTSALRTVTFRYVAVRPYLAGIYSGLATPTAVSTNPAKQVGLGRVSVLPNGAFTGTLTLGGSSVRIAISGTFGNEGAGRFGIKGASSLEIKRANLPSLSLALNLAVEESLAQRITGELSENGVVVSTIALDQLLYTTAKAPVAPKSNVPQSLLDSATDKGAYTGVFRALSPAVQGMSAADFPQGDGWAQIKVKPNGAVSVTGKLGDGQSFTYSNYLSKDNVLPLYLMPYAGRGSLSGSVNFRNVPAQSDTDGVGLNWYKPANPLDPAYPAGWNNGIEVDFVGSKFVSSALTGMTSLGNAPAAAATEPNALVTLSEGGLANAVSEQLAIVAPNRVFRLSLPSGPAGSIPPTTTLYANGYFAHRFVHPESGMTTVATGVVLQKTQTAGGYFLTALATGAPALRESGAVTISTE